MCAITECMQELDQHFRDVSRLPASERLLLAQRLLTSVLIETTPLTEAEIEEVHYRSAVIDIEKAECKAMEDVIDQLLGLE